MVWPSKKKGEVKEMKEEEKPEENLEEKITEETVEVGIPSELLLVKICDSNGIEVEARHVKGMDELKSLLLSPEDEVTSQTDESGNMIYTIKRR